MTIIKRIKSLFKGKKINQEIQEETNIVGFDTSHIFLPKIKDLSIEDQELVKRYISEIDLDNFETLINYSKDLSERANINTNILISYLMKLEELVSKIKYIKDENELLDKEIELKILESKIYLVNQNLIKIQKENYLRTIAISEVEKKQNNRIYEFLGIFKEAKRIRIRNLKRSLSEAVNKMKINIIVINSQRTSIENTITNLLNLINTLDIKNIVSKNQDSKSKLEKYQEKIEYFKKVFKVLFEEELIDKERLNEIINNFSNELEQELINRIAVIENILDKYVYENKDKLPLLVQELNKLEIKKENCEENLKKIEKIEVIFNLYGNQVSKEFINLLYNKKFYTLVSDIDSWSLWYDEFFCNPFNEIKNQKEMAIYEKIFFKEYVEFSTNQPIFDKFKKYHKDFMAKINKVVREKNFIWYNNENILRTILLLNHPELYKNVFNHNIKIQMNCWEKDYQVFEYHSNIFLPNETDSVYISHSLVERILDVMSGSIGSFINDFISYELDKFRIRGNNAMLFFLLLYGKYNDKNAYEFYNHTFEIQEGITKVIKNNDLDNASSSNLVFMSTKHYFNVNELNKMKLPESLESLEGLDSFIFDLNRVEEVNIPGNIKKITKDTLKDFTKYIHLTMPGPTKIILEEGIEEIDDYAFSKVIYLKQIYLPKSLKYLSETAFYHLPFLSEVYYYPSLLENLGNDIFDKMFKDYIGMKFIALEEEKVKVK